MHKALARQEQVCQAEADVHLIAREEESTDWTEQGLGTESGPDGVWIEVELDVEHKEAGCGRHSDWQTLRLQPGDYLRGLGSNEDLLWKTTVKGQSLWRFFWFIIFWFGMISSQ